MKVTQNQFVHLIQFHANPTFLNIAKIMTSWRPSFTKTKERKINRDSHTHLRIKFRKDRTIFEEVRFGHFECRKLPIFKWAFIQAKLKLIVKTPCLYHFWFWGSSPDKLSTKIHMAAILDVESNT